MLIKRTIASSMQERIELRFMEAGQGITEYAFIFSFVVLLLIVLLYFFGDRVEQTYRDILTALPF
jgi:hypothetical protein